MPSEPDLHPDISSHVEVDEGAAVQRVGSPVSERVRDVEEK